MSLQNYTRQRYYALENASDANSYGNVVLGADFKTVIIDLEQNALDGDLVVFVSDQYDEPDVTLPAGPNNDYHAVGYTDSRNGVYFGASNPYNPASASPGGDGRFNLETTGARWIIACVLNRVSGTVEKLAVSLFDNQ